MNDPLPHAPTADTPDIEGLGVFYLGTRVASETGEPAGPVLLDAKRLTTHAVCVGMTGSGKTGLLVGLLEEAAIDGIPSIVIDPKGDLGSILLNFPDLAAADFRSWVDPDAASREGISVDELAEQTARRWRDGLAASGQTPERIRRLRESAEMTIYTPGSRIGRPLSLLGSLEPPDDEIRSDPERLRERIESLASGILALAGIHAEPGRSREHLLLATIIDTLWKAGGPVGLGDIVRAIPAPPVERVGFFELEHFFPAADRFDLASRLNMVMAAPGFEAWLDGEPADIGRLLWTPSGKPKVSIVSIAHLSDAERMAFVTLLAGQTVSWMRSQRGTSSLRAIFMMDEVFGYLPPTANPPSKTPILTLLKQARAFGLGVVLATQNPVDLDYKGLSNAGIWFLGRLQTARDKARVVDGLEGAAASAGRSLDRGQLDRLLSSLGSRTFLLHSIYDDEETVFRTRWTLSYLRGPLARDEIAKLAPPASESPAAQRPSAAIAGGPRPILPPGVAEVFLAPTKAERDETPHYRAAIYGRGSVHYVKPRDGIDVVQKAFVVAAAPADTGSRAWEESVTLPRMPRLEVAPRDGGFDSLPPAIAGPKGQAALAKSLADHLYRTARLTLWKVKGIDTLSESQESEADFRLRIAHQLREARDAAVERVRGSYASKLERVEKRILTARQKLERQQAQARDHSLQTTISIGTAVLQAILGRGRSRSLGRVTTSMRSASRAAKQKGDVTHAEESLETLLAERDALEQEISLALDEVRSSLDPLLVELESVEIAPRKSDVVVDEVAILWVPEEPTAVMADLRASLRGPSTRVHETRGGGGLFSGAADAMARGSSPA
jgi:DNA helicase HerA-like ATPase